MTKWFIGILTLIGSALGIVFSYGALSNRRHNLTWDGLSFSMNASLEWFLSALGMLIFLWGIWCAIALFRNHAKGVNHSLIFWLVQIPVVSTSKIGYFIASVLSGVAYCNITRTTVFDETVSYNNYGFEFELGSAFSFWNLQSGESMVLGINLFALVVTFVLYRLKEPIYSGY